MIGFVTGLLVEHVLDPQADPARGELRAFRDPTSTPLDVDAQEIDLLPLSTSVVGWEIGGTVLLRHRVDAAVDVQHGDPAEARRLRDGIVLDLVRRLLAARGEIVSAVDVASGEAVTTVEVEVDYRPLGVDTANESATLTFTLDTTLDG